MSVYFIAQIQINDEKVYQNYLDTAGEVFKKFKGKYLAVDDSPMCLEGFWDKKRIVPIEFPSKEDMKAWYCSKEYQDILKYRLKAAECDSILVNGLV